MFHSSNEASVVEVFSAFGSYSRCCYWVSLHKFIPLASKFKNVFPIDSPDMSLKRDILHIGRNLVHPPYCMIFIVLTEIKDQIQELIDKSFISPSDSLWCPSCLFVKKYDCRIRLCINYRQLNGSSFEISIYVFE